MAQFDLPFEKNSQADEALCEPDPGSPVPTKRKNDAGKDSGTEIRSVKEKSLMEPGVSRQGQSQLHSAYGWPPAMTLADARNYSGLSKSQLRRWERCGALTVRKLGRNGAKVVLRSELDALLAHAFASDRHPDIGEDFDFG